MSCGIYKITNLINGKCYIGCSQNIEQRWQIHKSSIKNTTRPKYSIHNAFCKYGLDNFSFEIVELLEPSQLFEREKHWIDFYKSFDNGYNQTAGGDSGPSLPGESNPNAKLTEKDIIFIRSSILEGKMRSDIYPLYKDKISERGFTHVWLGTSWKNIMPEAIQYVQSDEYKSKVRSFARRSQISEEQIKIWNEIKEKRKKGLNRLEVYKEYENIYSLGGFTHVWYR